MNIGTLKDRTVEMMHDLFNLSTNQGFYTVAGKLAFIAFAVIVGIAIVGHIVFWLDQRYQLVLWHVERWFWRRRNRRTPNAR